jgi:hypothetical protein
MAVSPAKTKGLIFVLLGACLVSACSQTVGLDFPQKSRPNDKYMTAAQAKEAINELILVKERQQELVRPQTQAKPQSGPASEVIQ